MDISGNTILITGGATGIGLALAERFLQADNQVIICGRRADKLREVRQTYPQIHTRVCDVAQESERLALIDWVKSEFPATNVLVNNAGIQRRNDQLAEQLDWSVRQQEIAINLEAPIHLASLFIPHLARQPKAAILNVTSGLAFAPGAFAAIYSATKAALHSFTLTLRQQLAQTSIEVIEMVPPAVNTDLGGSGIHALGVPVDAFADAMLEGLRNGLPEIGYGSSETNRTASRQELDEIFKRMHQR